LEQLIFYKKAHKNDRAYQFWQECVRPELIQGNDMMKQKVDSIIHQLDTLPSSDLYGSNQIFCKLLGNNVLQKQGNASSPKCFVGDLV